MTLKEVENIRKQAVDMNGFPGTPAMIKLCDEIIQLHKALEEIRETIPSNPKLPLVCEILDIATEALNKNK